MGNTQKDRAIIDLVINGQQAHTSLKEVTLSATRARSALNKMHEADDPALYKKKLQEYHKIAEAQKLMAARINDSATAWQRFKKEALTVTTGVVGGNVATWGLEKLAGLLPTTIDHTLKIRDAFADIAKATGLSEEGVKKLNKELKDIDTRTSNSDLRGIAVAGGQLGVANEELRDFVENADRAVVALGDEFGGGVEQVAKEVGGLAKLFEETQNMPIGKAINDIGSALNELGAAGSATAPQVAEFTARIGQLGDLAPKISETMGLGAALQELGLSAEIGSSGLSRVLLTASQNTDLFGQQIRMTKEEVEGLINTSPNEFLLQLAKSFQGLSATQVSQRMKELKLDSDEAVKVMSLLATQTDFVREKQELAGKAMKEGTSLVEEFSKKNHQLARDLKALNEWFNSLLTSEGLQNFLVAAVHNTVSFIRILPQMGSWLSSNTQLIYFAVTALVLYHGALIKATVEATANTAAEVTRRIAYEVGYRRLLLMEALTKAHALATGVLTGQITLQTAATRIATAVWGSFTAVLAANPITIVAAALAALAGIVKVYSDNSERVLKIERDKRKLSEDLAKTLKVHSDAQETINDKMGDYINLAPQERSQMLKTIVMKRAEAQASLDQAKARLKNLQTLAAEPTAWQKFVGALKSGGGFGAFSASMAEVAADNMMEVAAAQGPAIEQLEEKIKGYERSINSVIKMNHQLDTVTNTSPGTIKDPNKTEKKTQAQKDQEELDKLLKESRKEALENTLTDYQKEVNAWAEKYTKMYDLAKGHADKMREVGLLAEQEFNDIEKKRAKNEAEKQAELQEKKVKAAQEELELEMALKKQALADQLEAGKLSPEEAKVGELVLEEQFLEAKKLLYTAHYQMLADLAAGDKTKQEQIAADKAAAIKAIETTIAQNVGDQARARTGVVEAEQKNQTKAEKLTLQNKKEIFNDSVAVLKGFFKQNTLIYKAALVAQQAWALSEVGILYAKAVMKAVDSAVGIPFPGNILAVAKSVAIPTLQAASSVAKIRAQKFDMPTFAEGGFTGLGDGPSGFVDTPTVFEMGRRRYLAGEAGEEFILNNRSLQNPVVANFARIMDSVQKSGNYSSLSQAPAAAASNPSNVNVSVDQMLVVNEIRQLRQAMLQQGSRPAQLNYRQFKKDLAYVEDIQERTKF